MMCVCVCVYVRHNGCGRKDVWRADEMDGIITGQRVCSMRIPLMSARLVFEQ